jgi:uncharacterized tellurite resistance protein B-like protein
MQLEAADLEATDDPQKLAIIESMLLAVFADGEASPLEIRKFDGIVERLPWGVDKPVLDAMVVGAMQRMQPLTTEQAILAFAAGIAQRVPAPALREKIVYTMAVLAEADGVMHQFEQNILGVMIVAFEIPPDRVAAIKAAVSSRRS